MWSLVKINFVIVLDHSIPLFFSFTPIVPRCYSIGGNTDKDLIKGLVVVVWRSQPDRARGAREDTVWGHVILQFVHFIYRNQVKRMNIIKCA